MASSRHYRDSPIKEKPTAPHVQRGCHEDTRADLSGENGCLKSFLLMDVFNYIIYDVSLDEMRFDNDPCRVSQF